MTGEVAHERVGEVAVKPRDGLSLTVRHRVSLGEIASAETMRLGKSVLSRRIV
jgi:hypothetical protein